MSVTSNDLSILRTKFSNQRTYLAYMRTGFTIAGIAGSFKKYWIAVFGLTMIIGSSLQYYLVNKKLNQKTKPSNEIFDYIPFIYVLLSFGALYLQMQK